MILLLFWPTQDTGSGGGGGGSSSPPPGLVLTPVTDDGTLALTPIDD